MSDGKTELECSADLWQLLNEVNLDKVLGHDEFEVLREAADSRLHDLARLYNYPSELTQFQYDCQCMAQSMRDSCLILGVAQFDQEERSRVREAFEYQVAYLQACLQRAIEQP